MQKIGPALSLFTSGLERGEQGLLRACPRSFHVRHLSDQVQDWNWKIKEKTVLTIASNSRQNRLPPNAVPALSDPAWQLSPTST